MPTELRAAVGVARKPWHNFVRPVSAATVPKRPNTRHRMKIVKLEDFHADGGWDTYSFLKITTDEGITGWSEFNESRRKGMTALIHGLGATLIGEDPCATARIDAALYARSRSTAGGLTSHAIAAIENACLDIRGKALGVPVYELLGGAVRERMPVYWSRCGVLRARCADLVDGKVIDRPAVRTLDDLKAAAREARERGFKALKTNVLLFDAKGGRQFAPGMVGAGPAIPSSTSTTTSSMRSSLSSPRCAKARETACGSCSISTSTISPRGCGASPRRSSRSI